MQNTKTPENDKNSAVSPADLTNKLANENLDPVKFQEFTELLDFKSNEDEQWPSEGFESGDSFISAKGDVVSISRLLQPDEVDGSFVGNYWDSPNDQTWRIAIGDQTKDVTVPKKIAGQSETYRGDPGYFGYVFDTKAEDGNTPLAEASQGLQWLHENFGDKLLIRSDSKATYLVSDKLTNTMVGIASIAEKQNSIIDQAHGEALRIEQEAQLAKQRLQKKLFESTGAFAKRQYAAYRSTTQQ